jgi:hypothetical protein
MGAVCRVLLVTRLKCIGISMSSAFEDTGKRIGTVMEIYPRV